MTVHLPRINPGERTVVSGRTGSGKTTLAAFLLSRSPQHWVIFNPKHTAGYAELENAIIVHKFDPKEIPKLIEKHRYVIVNFPGEQSEPEFMDACISFLHENFSNIGLCADELYTLHNNGRPGPGLVGWLTRGRELKQSFLGLTQRPAWVSRFVYSEASAIVGMDLTLKEDRKRLYESTGIERFNDRLTPHYWRWYNVAGDHATLWRPVPIS